ncbi:hypothetical protein WLF18_01175 [Pseudomonas shirazensis]|uniref:Uncharacterized protein n=1 Tax=Pseudomonas shirazensis TaxID=2745494 RepID=A0ABU8ZUM6_9PSED
MDTNKMREEFEQWARDRYSWHLHDDARDPEDRTLASWNGDAYGNRIVEGMWQAWKASREAVVVELPSACAHEGLTEHLGSVIELTYEAPEHDPVGLARLPDVRAAIEAQGLRVTP